MATITSAPSTCCSGTLFAGGATAQALASLGLDGQAVERLLAIEFAEIQARRKAG